MDCVNVGKTIKKLRLEKNLKQYELADKMNLSDKTISKWERGLGVPDVNLLDELAKILDTSIEVILNGNLYPRPQNSGSLNNLKFYLCPKCNNLIASFDQLSACCCGKKIAYIPPKKAEKNEELVVEKIENRLFVHSSAPMTKDNYILFVAYIKNDCYVLKRTYAEWDLQLNFFNEGSGKFVWAKNDGQIFYQIYKN